MNILLINPFWPYPYSKGEYTYNRIWPPLCLANCAALLEKEGFNVKILDAHAQRIAPYKIINFIRGYDKIFITSSSLDRWQCPNIDIDSFLKTIQYIKELTDEIYIMGYHGTIEPEKILVLTQAKAVIRGEPEITIVDICKNNDLFKIKGISFRNKDRFISNPNRELLDLKILPIPAYHLLDIKKYFYEILGKNFCLFEITRGCKFKCRFCNKVMYREGLRIKSEKQIFEEVSIAVEKYNIKTGYFIDLDFLSNREIVEKLCEYLIKKKYRFKWACQTRPDLLDIEILKKMKKARCEIIHMGIETIIQASLDYLNKHINVEKIKRVTKLCKKNGIKTLAFFLFGLPNEKEKDRERVFNFCKDLNFDFISFHRIVPYKGTDIYQNNFGINGDTAKFIRKAFVKYYLRPAYLLRLNPLILLKCLRLFYERIKTL